MIGPARIGFFLLFASSCVMAKELPEGIVDEVPNQEGLLPLKTPRNTAAYVGSTVTLTCWASRSNLDKRIQWVEYATNPSWRLISDDIFIDPLHPQAARYKILHNNPLQYDLVISNVNLVDGGRYQCSDVNAPITDKIKKRSAELVVIAEPDDCYSNFSHNNQLFENTYYTVECYLKFSGNIILFSNWEGPQPFLQARSSATKDKVWTLWTGMAFYANRTFYEQNWKLTFNFTRDLISDSGDNAQNVPSFEFTYRTPTVTVVWPPSNVTAAPLKYPYSVGDVITCNADANPTSDFIWTNLRTSETFPGSILTIPSVWAGSMQTCWCQAASVINGIVFTRDLYIKCDVSAQ